MKIGAVSLDHPVALAPMAGMTDTAFRRLVKRQGGCGLVVSEMVSSEGLVRGIDRTLEYAEYTEEERPVSIQIFGGDPAVMADAAQIVESMGADIVDVNMGCPVPKIAKHNAGCSLMREPEHAASVIRAMAKAVRIPVTVKMRAGWNEREINAPDLAKLVEDAGAAALAVHGRTAAQSYSGESDWNLIDRVASGVRVPVFGSGDCVEPGQVVDRLRNGAVSGVLVGRGALRNPWIFQHAAIAAAGQPPPAIPLAARGRFLLEYIELLIHERVDEADGFRHVAPTQGEIVAPPPARGRERWVINKLRALNSWYTKGLEGGSQLRVRINAAESIPELQGIIQDFFEVERAESAAMALEAQPV
ncbi:MAG TPA: tRNA dihydrouridine synthase DusB [Vicinamibacterales bacterium]|nr:tRNA dihydrouridine synthase DusB [Vicinamibacterales bacterium]